MKSIQMEGKTGKVYLHCKHIKGVKKIIQSKKRKCVPIGSSWNQWKITSQPGTVSTDTQLRDSDFSGMRLNNVAQCFTECIGQMR